MFYGGPLCIHSCWVSTDKGAIWAFAGPMIAVLLVSAPEISVLLIKPLLHFRSMRCFWS